MEEFTAERFAETENYVKLNTMRIFVNYYVKYCVGNSIISCTREKGKKMKKSTLDENEKKLLLQELKERLDFYTFQASEEQFDAQKVEVLVKQIQELESDGSVAKQNASRQDFEAFQKYRAEKSADAERLAALDGEGKATDADYLTASGAVSGSGDIKKRSAVYGRQRGSSGFVRAAAVGIAVLLAVGGSIGAVNAQKDEGLIRWLKKSVYGEVILVEPEKDNFSDEFGEDTETFYHSPEELPEPYRKYFVDLEGMEGLEGYEQEQISLFRNKISWRLELSWKNAKQESLIFSIWGIKDSVVVQDRRFDKFEDFYDKEVNGIELHVCTKQEDSGEKDVSIYFYNGNRRYMVEGRLSLEVMEQIAAEYAERVLEENK